MLGFPFLSLLARVLEGGEREEILPDDRNEIGADSRGFELRAECSGVEDGAKGHERESWEERVSVSPGSRTCILDLGFIEISPLYHS